MLLSVLLCMSSRVNRSYILFHNIAQSFIGPYSTKLFRVEKARGDTPWRGVGEARAGDGEELGKDPGRVMGPSAISHHG